MITDDGGGAPPAVWRRWLREPLVQFLLIGGVLFAAHARLNPPVEARLPASQIRLTANDLDQMAMVWALKWQRPPTPEEMARLIDDKVRGEILYREALALGLDQDDTIVKRRLAQKMEFLAEDMSGIRDPEREELRVWFEQNRERFALPGRMSFRHVYFSPDERGQEARAGAAKALPALLGEPAESATAASLGDRFMFSDYYADRVPEQVASVFGTTFAQALTTLAPGVWQGPIESGLGWHLVYVDSLSPGRVPAFEEVEVEVKGEWISGQRAEAKSKAFAAMRARYEIVLPASGGGGRPAAAPREAATASR